MFTHVKVIGWINLVWTILGAVYILTEIANGKGDDGSVYALIFVGLLIYYILGTLFKGNQPK